MKKLKKLVAVIMAAAMMLTLVACGSSTDGAKEGATTAKEEVAASDLKVGFIFLHDENSTYDLNFINAAKEACEAAGVEYVLKTNIPEGQECYDAACELADAGCGIVFADSFGHEDYLIEAAKEFPDVEFCHATGTQAHTAGVPNFHNAFATIYEGRYLAGIAA